MCVAELNTHLLSMCGNGCSLAAAGRLSQQPVALPGGQGKHTVLYDADGDVRDEDLAAMRWTLLPQRQEQSKGARGGPTRAQLARLHSAQRA